MTSILHTLWRMGFQACIPIITVLMARQFLKRYSGFYTRLLWLPVIVRLLCPVFIETEFGLQPGLPSLQELTALFREAPAQATLSSAARAMAAIGRPNTGPDGDFGTGATGTGTQGAATKSPAGWADAYGIGISSNLPQNGTNTPKSLPSLPQNGTGAPPENISMAADTKPTANKVFSPAENFLPMAKTLLPALYLLGCAVVSLIFCIQYILLKRRISTAVCEGDGVWLCEDIASPFVVGIFRPKIILPYHMEAGAKMHVLSHEQTHIRHHDPLLHFLGILCLCLHWWNPLVWLAVHKINQDMEMFCDESTLRLAADGKRKDYAKTLLSFAEQQSSLHAGPAFGESNTERRVKNIMKRKKKNFLVLGLVVLLAVFCTVAFMTIPKAANKKETSKNEEAGKTPEGAGSTDAPTLPPPATTPLVSADDSTVNGTTVMPDSGKTVIHTLDPMSVLQDAALFLPDFWDTRDMDENFWKDYLFATYTSSYAPLLTEIYKVETVEHDSGQYGHSAIYNKITAKEVNRVTTELFGTALSESVSDPYQIEDGINILYEDESYYISVSDSPDFRYGTAEELPAPDGMKIISFPKYLEDGEEPISQITLHLKAAETQYGYVITRKEEKNILAKGTENTIPTAGHILLFQQKCCFMPDFMDAESLDAAFWQDYLFHAYTQDFFGEKVNRYSARRDMTAKYAKVDPETLDEDIKNLFGKALSDFVPNPQDLTKENGDIVFEDGYYYIRIPSQTRCSFDTAEIQAGQGIELHYLVYTFSAYPESQVTLYLQPSETEYGYIITGKETAGYTFLDRGLTGSWVVTGYVPTPDGSALPIQECEAFVGTQLKFRPDHLVVNGQAYPVNEYQKELVTAREFEDIFRLDPGEDLSLSTTALDHYSLKMAGSKLPFGSHVYRFDFEGAFILYEGVFFRIVELTENLEEETALDQLNDLRFAMPDENGFVEGSFLPYQMLPGSIIYYTDDTHYIIVRGGISLDTPEKMQEYRDNITANILDSVAKGYHFLPFYRPEEGMSVTYMEDGAIGHDYPRSYPRKKLAEGMLNWCYEGGSCRAVAAGIDTTQPKVYYQAVGGDWQIYPLTGFENYTKDELGRLTLLSVTADENLITVVFTKDGEEIVKNIKVRE